MYVYLQLSIIIGYSRLVNKINTQDLNKINIEEIEIPFVDQVKSLRITIDKCFTWQPYVAKTCRRVFGALHKIRLSGHFMSKNLKHRLVESSNALFQVLRCDLYRYNDCTRIKTTKSSKLLREIYM